MKNFLINTAFCLLLLAGVAACGLAAKSSYNKCSKYSHGDTHLLRECLNF